MTTTEMTDVTDGQIENAVNKERAEAISTLIVRKAEAIRAEEADKPPEPKRACLIYDWL